MKSYNELTAEMNEAKRLAFLCESKHEWGRSREFWKQYGELASERAKVYDTEKLAS